jgi:hypothetical protein
MSLCIPKTFCNRCKLNKTLEEMVYSSVYGAGYKFLCKSCDAKDTKERRNKDKEKEKKSQKRSYEKHKEKILKHKKEVYYPKVKTQRSEYNKKYLNENKEELNRKNTIRQRERRKRDPFVRLRVNIAHRIRNSLKSKGLTKSKRTWEILGTDKKGLTEYFMNTQKINILNAEEIQNKELDHICPLAQAQNEDELIKLNHYTNLQLISRKENRDKWHRKTSEAEEKCHLLLGRDWID